jgi:hypothetical protein
MPVPFLLLMGAFLLFWLSLWTVGGITAMGELLRLTWSEDRIVAGPAGLTLHTSRGPFRKKVDIPRDEVRAIVPSARGSALAGRNAAQHRCAHSKRNPGGAGGSGGDAPIGARTQG